MTSTFLGKWRIYVPPYLTADAGYAGYNPGTTGFAVSSDTPGKAQNIAFILRSDGQLCFLLNNDQYVGGKNELFLFLPFVSTLDQATPFVFPGFDPRSLPASFTTKIQVVTGFFMVNLMGALIGNDEYDQFDPKYQMVQVTPALESVLASGKGDGLDFACVDLTGTNFQNLSLIGADFSNCNLTSHPPACRPTISGAHRRRRSKSKRSGPFV